MKVQRLPRRGLDSPRLSSRNLAPEVLDGAVTGVGWTGLICAVTTVAFTAIQCGLQPEFANAWAHPALRITSACLLLLSLGFIWLKRSGRLSERRLLDLSALFEVAVAPGRLKARCAGTPTPLWSASHSTRSSAPGIADVPWKVAAPRVTHFTTLSCV